MLLLSSSGELCKLFDVTQLIVFFEPTGTLVMPMPSACSAPLTVRYLASSSSDDACRYWMVGMRDVVCVRKGWCWRSRDSAEEGEAAEGSPRLMISRAMGFEYTIAMSWRSQ